MSSPSFPCQARSAQRGVQLSWIKREPPKFFIQALKRGGIDSSFERSKVLADRRDHFLDICPGWQGSPRKRRDGNFNLIKVYARTLEEAPLDESRSQISKPSASFGPSQYENLRPDGPDCKTPD